MQFINWGAIGRLKMAGPTTTPWWRRPVMAPNHQTPTAKSKHHLKRARLMQAQISNKSGLVCNRLQARRPHQDGVNPSLNTSSFIKRQSHLSDWLTATNSSSLFWCQKLKTPLPSNNFCKIPNKKTTKLKLNRVSLRQTTWMVTVRSLSGKMIHTMKR